MDRPEFGYSICGSDPAVVLFRGEIDVATVPLLSIALDDLLLSPDQDVELDLSAVEFMDCSGVHFLERAIIARRSVGRTLVLSSVSDRVRRVLQLVGVDQVLPLLSGQEQR
jgi:anti-anti-sigma factor